MKHISIAEMLNNPESYNESNFYGFYDWFCSDKSLKSKFKAMLPKIKFLIKHNIINPETTYVWFKNNCPCDGSLYTDIRFSLLDADNTFIGGICPSSGHTSEFGLCSVWYFEDKQLKEIEFESWLDFKNTITTDNEMVQTLQEKLYKL